MTAGGRHPATVSSSQLPVDAGSLATNTPTTNAIHAMRTNERAYVTLNGLQCQPRARKSASGRDAPGRVRARPAGVAAYAVPHERRN
jgi:hypothetical protein